MERKAQSALLRVRGLCAGYDGVNVLKDVNIDVAATEIVTIIGPNGAGKSTLLKAIMGYVDVSSGSIEFDHKNILMLKPNQRATLGIGYVPQLENVFPSLTVLENLKMGGYVYGHAQVRARIEEVCKIFPKLKERKNQYVQSLSGGERQTLALARALITKPRIVLLDEPSAALSPRMSGDVFEQITDMKRLGTAVVIVEQEARGSLAISDRGYVLAEGRNVFNDRADRLLANEQIRNAYLGVETAH